MSKKTNSTGVVAPKQRVLRPIMVSEEVFELVHQVIKLKGVSSAALADEYLLPHLVPMVARSQRLVKELAELESEIDAYFGKRVKVART